MISTPRAVMAGNFIPPTRQPIDRPLTPQTIGSIVRLATHETVFMEGDDAQSLYRVIAGAVRLCKILPGGRRLITDFAFKDDQFGLELDAHHKVTAETIEPTVLLRTRRCPPMQQEQAEFHDNIIGALRRDLSAAQAHVVILGHPEARARVAAFLMSMIRRLSAGHPHTIDLPMGRQDIADYLCLTIETVCRSLSELRRAHVIDIPSRHRIAIKDMNSLEAMTMGEE